MTPPQQIEADLIKTAMVLLDEIFRRKGTKARIVTMIHDSIWVEAPHGEDKEVRNLVQTTMTTLGKLEVALGVDVD